MMFTYNPVNKSGSLFISQKNSKIIRRKSKLNFAVAAVYHVDLEECRKKIGKFIQDDASVDELVLSLINGLIRTM